MRNSQKASRTERSWAVHNGLMLFVTGHFNAPGWVIVSLSSEAVGPVAAWS